MKTDYCYFDHAAATPVHPLVLSAMLPALTDGFFNPSSPYAPAVAVRREYEAAKARIARTIGAKGDEIIITAGATESVNLAFSLAHGHVVATTIEHHAVLAAAQTHDHTLVTVDTYGQVSPDDVQAAIRADTTLVSCALANNELGTIQPITELAAVVKRVRDERLECGNHTPLYFHCDASQGVGLLDVQVARLGVDLLTVNAGKVYGPKQVALLWVRAGVQVTPQIVGGGQERGLRSGTENVAGVLGFAAALEYVTGKRRGETRRLQQLRDELETQLVTAFPDSIVSGHPRHRLASHLHISFPGLDAERLVFLLETKSVLVATGSACAANKGTRSHVLTAIGLAPEVADGSLRLTLGQLSDDDTVQRGAAAIIEAVCREKERVGR